MKLTAAKKTVLKVGAALIGIALLSGIAGQPMDEVFETASYSNVNLVPSLFLHRASGRHRP